MKKPSARPANTVIGAGVRDLLAREFEEQEFTPSYSQWLTPQPAEPLPPAPQPFRPPPPWSEHYDPAADPDAIHEPEPGADRQAQP